MNTLDQYRDDNHTLALFVSKGNPKSVSLEIARLKDKTGIETFHDEKGHVAWIFRVIDTDILMAIDQNDPILFQKELEQSHLPIDQKFAIPQAESDGETQLQTFLHRSLQKQARTVFRYLLENGANPTIKDANGRTVLDALINDTRIPAIIRYRFGKDLAEAAMTEEEIKAYRDTHQTSRVAKKFCDDLLSHLQNKRTYQKIASQKTPVTATPAERVYA